MLDELRHEHRMIRRVLRVLNSAADRWQQQPVDPEGLIRLIRLLQDYANQFHQRVEEEVLFPELEKEGIPQQGGPLEVLLAEHREGMGYLKELEDYLQRLRQGEAAIQAELADTVRAYSLLLLAHIGKEDMVILPLAAHARLGKGLSELSEEIRRNLRDAAKEAEFDWVLRELEEELGLPEAENLDQDDGAFPVEPDALADEFLREQ
ncbi:MAG TPA: hemerythrin domain-containing protein [Bacillota bacterium]|jgi:hemerythrin-like domain-containing protein|nr:hemerythrin domain-containing protein [Bacillota bacterium]HPT68262.1 hemerythrin domain-containing protein [Bacillota bacterium]